MDRHQKSNPEAASAAAKQWLEGHAAMAASGPTKDQIWAGSLFDSACLSALHGRISHCAGGRVVASFRIPPHLADSDGNWEAGAIVTLVDDIGAAAIMTTVGHIKVSVELSVSCFAPAEIGEEVEIDAKVIDVKGDGKLTAVAIEVRKTSSGEIVAVGRQWMATSHPQSKL